VRIEAVLDRLLGDGLVLVGLVDRVERAVAGNPDLDDDGDEEQDVRTLKACLIARPYSGE